MSNFSQYLVESVQPSLLNERAQFKMQHDGRMIKTVSEFSDWFYRGYGRGYTTDGKYSFSRYNSGPKITLYVTETGNYGKSGNSMRHSIYITDSNELMNSITSIDGIVAVAESLVGSAVSGVSPDAVKNISSDCFNPVMLKNFKSVGSIASKDKVTKAQARKIIASGDFDNITHNYQMRDDNYSSSGEIELTYAMIADILGDLDSKHTSIFNKKGSESFSIYVHSNLSYYINRD